MLPTKAIPGKLHDAPRNGLFPCVAFRHAVVEREIFLRHRCAASETSRIKLGTGGIHSPNRLAAVAASGSATLNTLASE